TQLNSQGLTTETKNQAMQLGLTAQQILDRWMGGWPKRTLEMQKDGSLLSALQEQADREKTVEADNPNYSHLAKHEKMAVFGIDPQPPGA
ncbi:MAG: hypothetical protein ACK51V_01905, partial [bacterium]